MLRSSRWSALPFAHRLLFCILLFAPLVASAAASCAGDPLLTLTVTAGEAVVAEDRQLIVQVHDDGCVALHRPVFYREAGDYRLQLDPAQWQALRAQIDALRAVDVAKTRTELVARQATQRRDGAPTMVEVVDADRFELAWRVGGKQAGIAWSGLHGDAEMHPEIEALGRLSRSVAVLQSLASRTDAEKIAGAQP